MMKMSCINQIKNNNLKNKICKIVRDVNYVLFINEKEPIMLKEVDVNRNKVVYRT